MAKCTDKEREVLDAFLQYGSVDPELVTQALEERVTKEMRNRLKYAKKHVIDAVANLENMRSEFYSISYEPVMQALVTKIESEANDLK